MTTQTNDRAVVTVHLRNGNPPAADPVPVSAMGRCWTATKGCSKTPCGRLIAAIVGMTLCFGVASGVGYLLFRPEASETVQEGWCCAEEWKVDSWGDETRDCWWESDSLHEDCPNKTLKDRCKGICWDGANFSEYIARSLFVVGGVVIPSTLGLCLCCRINGDLGELALLQLIPPPRA